MQSALTVAVALPAALRDMFFPAPLDQRLAAAGRLVLPPPGTDPRDPESFARLLADVDAVVTGWGCPPLTASVLDGAPRLRLLAHTGASVRPYVTADGFARGVRVTQAGAAMAHAVGEQALALTLALLHRLHRFDHALRAGAEWTAAKAAPSRYELRGSPVGVVGASRTGCAYIALVRALGAEVRCADPYLSEPAAAELGVTRTGLDELLRGCRVVSLHAPVLPDTVGLLGARELALLPDSALLVNTARSALVDGAALLAELESGRIDAALDVFDEEPLPVTHPLRGLPNVLLTPHEAAGTQESRRRAGEIVLAELGRFSSGAPLEHEVTEPMLARMG
ncbi:hydroxyacid dehydrogenase [Rugosimonospora africana]|uniref:2-hydroxyacid dehydrogenase n=1 Tax=Rugosimonospora africana TaxID=556532 RepID=A0A8J3R022_9ACTN|nr:hydroxyacid dehydrogenase [Rugosimonospora africana]GIH19741.1 2-hydroxyacid dehydrogenase [Rugosimonospora africana]